MSQRPIVSFFDPLTWSREFSYQVEAGILEEAGAELIVPTDEAERDVLLPLADALDDGRIRMAALDVRDPEPPEPEHDRLSSPSDVIQTPHMAAMSERTRSDVHHLVGRNIVAMLSEAGRLPTRVAS